jgi:hypothetical protein
VLGTPLLVPSFSSKGFPRGPDGKSEIGDFLRYASEFLTKTCLISAYDIHYGHIPQPEAIPLNLEIVFLDSGGYEVSWDQDQSATSEAGPGPGTWHEDLYREVLEAWPDGLPAVFISYDHPNDRLPVDEQIARARKLFRANPHHLHLFLLKPDNNDKIRVKSALKDVLVDAEGLAPFDLVGITEKELGASLLERMANIAKLRQALDSAGIRSPIHVFGALDPLSVSLYFVAGAEVFDGLTWMRYAYASGRCVYFQNHAALQYGLHITDRQARLRAMTENIYVLEALANRMREFTTNGDYTKFDGHAQLIRNAVDSLSTRLTGGH